MKNKILNPIIIFLIGLMLGIVSKLFDIYIEILGNIFSEFAVWILFGTLISIYSDNKKKAMIDNKKKAMMILLPVKYSLNKNIN